MWLKLLSIIGIVIALKLLKEIFRFIIRYLKDTNSKPINEKTSLKDFDSEDIQDADFEDIN